MPLGLRREALGASLGVPCYPYSGDVRRPCAGLLAATEAEVVPPDEIDHEERSDRVETSHGTPKKFWCEFPKWYLIKPGPANPPHRGSRSTYVHGHRPRFSCT